MTDPMDIIANASTEAARIYLGHLDDEDVTRLDRELFARLQATPGWHHEHAPLLRAWGMICGEIGRRGLPSVIPPPDAGGTITQL